MMGTSAVRQAWRALTYTELAPFAAAAAQRRGRKREARPAPSGLNAPQRKQEQPAERTHYFT